MNKCTVIEQLFSFCCYNVQLYTKVSQPILKDMWRVLQGHGVEGFTGATTAPVEDPPDLKKSKLIKISKSLLLS